MGVMEIVSESENDMTDTADTTPAYINPIMVTTTVEVPFERVTDCLTGAIEGGSGYWCNQFMAASDDKSTRLYQSMRNSDKVWYDEAAYWQGGGKAELAFDKPTDDHSGKAAIGLEQLVKGLNVMARVAPGQFGHLINENDDASTHDVYLQCVLFGEIIFG